MKCYNHEAQPSRGAKRGRDEEQVMKKQTSRMKPLTHKKKIIKELQQKNCTGRVSRKKKKTKKKKTTGGLNRFLSHLL